MMILSVNLYRSGSYALGRSTSASSRRDDSREDFGGRFPDRVTSNLVTALTERTRRCRLCRPANTGRFRKLIGVEVTNTGRAATISHNDK